MKQKDGAGILTGQVECSARCTSGQIGFIQAFINHPLLPTMCGEVEGVDPEGKDEGRGERTRRQGDTDRNLVVKRVSVCECVSLVDAAVLVSPSHHP